MKLCSNNLGSKNLGSKNLGSLKSGASKSDSVNSFAGKKLLSALSLSVTLAAASLGASQAYAETFTFATNTAVSGLRGEAEKGFVDALTEVSNGEVDVVPYWGGSLLKGDEILDGVKNGITDMGFININYYPTRLLLNSAFQLFPEGPADYDTKMDLYKQIYAELPALDAEFEKQGQKIVYAYTYLPYAFISRDELTGIDDLKGKRVRASSRWLLNLLEGMEATPVSVPWGDTYQALQSGAIDGVMTNYDSIARVGMDEIAPNILATRELWVAVPILLTMNLDKWNSLSPEMQGYVEKAREVATERFSQYYATSFDSIVEAEKAAGYNVTIASRDEIDRVINLQAIKDNEQVWIEQAKEKGMSNPEQMLEQMGNVINASLGAQ